MLFEPAESWLDLLDAKIAHLEHEMIPSLRSAGLDAFVLFTTPPIHRAPGIPSASREARRRLEAHWNERLRAIGGVAHFDVEPHFTAALDRPDRFGFRHGDGDICSGYSELPTIPVSADFRAPDCPDPIDAYVWRDSLRACACSERD